VNSDVNPPTHVFSLNPGLAVGVLDRILTATEQSLDEAAATRVWAERSRSGIVVMAGLFCPTRAPGGRMSSPRSPGRAAAKGAPCRLAGAERPGQGARPGEHISPGPADARVAEGPQPRSGAASADQGGNPRRRPQERPVIGTRSMVHGLTVIGLAGDLDVATVAELRRQLAPRPSASLPDLALDLREVAFMDCAVVGALIAARNDVADAGGCVRLAGPGMGVRRILSLCHLDEVFCIYDTLSEATEPVCARHRLP
jgi:anti-anti-sigma factor